MVLKFHNAAFTSDRVISAVLYGLGSCGKNTFILTMSLTSQRLDSYANKTERPKV